MHEGRRMLALCCYHCTASPVPLWQYTLMTWHGCTRTAHCQCHQLCHQLCEPAGSTASGLLSCSLKVPSIIRATPSRTQCTTPSNCVSMPAAAPLIAHSSHCCAVPTGASFVIYIQKMAQQAAQSLAGSIQPHTQGAPCPDQHSKGVEPSNPATTTCLLPNVLAPSSLKASRQKLNRHALLLLLPSLKVL